MDNDKMTFKIWPLFYLLKSHVICHYIFQFSIILNSYDVVIGISGGVWKSWGACETKEIVYLIRGRPTLSKVRKFICTKVFSQCSTIFLSFPSFIVAQISSTENSQSFSFGEGKFFTFPYQSHGVVVVSFIEPFISILLVVYF